ncbi:hypothetical protein H2198_003624 [Neophaeococcomyces mojaviensis]|uniref:Uncharacterized protein n=1 Tax=Neophaeococcomyces mojaviensis TaxID=3383035 RepID=A0ACC3AB40_9EURO|nr:hypothetical protein H2198_003624 [Knufia sp. JES_112]
MAQINIQTVPHSQTKPSAIVSTIEVPTPPVSPPPQAPRTISELISLRARLARDQPILGYPTQGVQYVEYTYGQIDNFATSGARLLAPHLPLRPNSATPEAVVAILGPSSLDYFVTVLALSRLGFTVLFLSTRISEAAYVSLLKSTKCTNICIDPSFEKTISGGVKTQVPGLNILNVLSKSQYGSFDNGNVSNQQLDLSQESSKVSWIIHSSGSTGLPKPIYQTHAAALRNYENNMGLEGFITLPLFHAHGLSSVLRGFTSHKRIFMYNASIPLTSQNLLDIFRQYQFEIFYGVPYALKLLSESDEGLQMLASMKVVMFGGSACPDGLGDLLVENGVNLISHYGTTETGQLMTSFRPAGDKAWNYLRVHDKLAPFVRFEPQGGNLFELVILDGWPSKVATNREDGAYATKDLFEPHPSIEAAWKYGGRLDDTIVLMNGEKAIPIPTEMAVRHNALVKDAVIFGAGKARLGMMIIASDAASDLQEEALIDTLWPTIEKENRDSPGFAQISREMVVVLPAGTTYPQTDKGTLIRQAFYKAFAQQIEELYQKLEATATGTLVLNDVEMRSYLREQILNFVPGLDAQDIADETDLFSLGVDSLQSSRLRGKILQDVQLNGHKISQNIVFEQPSIAKLATALIAARDGAATVSANVEDEMASLISKYAQFPAHVPTQSQSDHKIVVVTGATGSLGAHVAAQLAVREDITEVCCLVRAPSQRSAMRRTLKSMQDRAVLHSLPLEARRKITAYPSNFAQSDLGLDAAVLDHLKSGIVSLIHCAWSVNFNKRLSSFEADCIAGARNLMMLCLAAQGPKPASFNFCSSVSTVARTPGPLVPEALPESLQCAQGMGYAQSKLVTEHIIAKAAEQTGMAARVLRVGQIVADTTHGIWNNTEAIPLMLQAATTIGVLPTLDELPRWLPVDVVANSVNDISLSGSTVSFFNVVNPNTFHWTDDLLSALENAGLTFERVSQREWVKRLRASNSDVTTNPTFKLLEFFASKYDHDRPAKTGLDYETKALEALSPAIRSCPALTQDLVNRFVQNFLATSWTTTSSTSTTPQTTEPESLQKTTLVVLAGPCGSGKSSVATNLAHRLACPSIEGDSLHDAIAITKMSNGVPLSSLDREIWLARVRIAILERLRAAQMLDPLSVPKQIILTCSALKRQHRAALRHMLSDGSLVTQFVMLEASEDELVRRVEGRRGHYMKSNMIRSQLEALEQPAVEERDVLPVDTEGSDGDSIVEEVCEVLGY